MTSLKVFFYVSYIFQRILVQEDKSGSSAYCNGTEFIQSIDAFGRVSRAYADGLKRREARVDPMRHFLIVLTCSVFNLLSLEYDQG
jgi:hypothetical protein